MDAGFVTFTLAVISFWVYSSAKVVIVCNQLNFNRKIFVFSQISADFF